MLPFTPATHANMLTTIEKLCEAACGILSGQVIDLSGKVLRLDGSYRSQIIQGENFVELQLCGPGTTIRNGTLHLKPDVDLLVAVPNVTLDGLTIISALLIKKKIDAFRINESK